MSNPFLAGVLVLAESVAAKVPGSFDRLRLVFRTVGIDEFANELVRETLGEGEYRKLVA